MVHPPRPGAQCRHQTPAGFWSSSTCASLQHSEQSPQLRPVPTFGACASSLMTGICLPYNARHRHDAIFAHFSLLACLIKIEGNGFCVGAALVAAPYATI